MFTFVSATADRTRGGYERRNKFDAALTGLISNYAKQHHLTVNSLMQGYGHIFYRYTGRLMFLGLLYPDVLKICRVLKEKWDVYQYITSLYQLRSIGRYQ
ncbi:hypothetical protein CS542_09080 [Pedobacter sp. IW39]|nr:hypothetical protein CS542_09080 [Pedobacter sp. IW39]